MTKKTDRILKQLNVYKRDIHTSQQIIDREIAELKVIIKDIDDSKGLVESEGLYDNGLEFIQRNKRFFEYQIKPWSSRLLILSESLHVKLGLLVKQVNKIEDDINKFREGQK